MKLVDMYGQPQRFPFALGEQGRGRRYEEVRVDARRPPTGDDVGFATFTVGGRAHCVVTQSTRQPGCLVRINSRGTYTRGSRGFIQHIAGDATCITTGKWACGDAGRLGSGPDDLWHVRGPSLFLVCLSGGAEKGYGNRYVVADGSGAKAFRQSDLFQIIATDDDPWVSNILRDLRGNLPEDLAEAVAAGERLESAVEAAAEESEVRHYLDSGTLESAASDARLALPFGYSGGFDRVESGTLMPGHKSLVSVMVGPGGGKRYNYEVLSIEGIEVLYREPVRTSGNHCSLERIVGLASGDFSIRWRESRDGAWGDELTATRESVRGEPW